MKTKITLSIAGLLLGLGLGAGALTAYAAEPAVVPVSTVMSQADAASLKTSLDTLRVVLDQLNSDLQSGRITAANAESVNVALASAKDDLLVLRGTLAILYPLSENYAKSEVSPAPTAQIEPELNQNIAAEAAPLGNSNGQTSLASILQSRATVGIVLVVVLVAVIVFVSRRKPKVETQTT